MQQNLNIGQSAELSQHVGHEHTIRLGDGAAEVFSTPAMIDLMEHAAREAMRPALEWGEESVGMDVHVQHLAATPVGCSVRAVATVTAFDERTVSFDVVAYDDLRQIGKGTHRRAVIQLEKFAGKLSDRNGTPPGLPIGIVPNSGSLPDLSTLLVHSNGEVLVVTLNRPDKRNALSQRMTAELEAVVAWLAGHPDAARVVILTGAGPAFCAGVDVHDVAPLSLDEAHELSLRQARLFLAFEKLPQPIIAAVNGHALGGGCVAAFSCDFRIASHSAEFGMPEVALGWPPGYGVSQLIALIGKARALELCLTAKRLPARQAFEWGLVNDVVPANALMESAMGLARLLLAQPPIALRETKRLLHADEGQWPKQTYRSDTAAYIRCLETQDAREGIAAFLEKRPPRFEGR